MNTGTSIWEEALSAIGGMLLSAGVFFGWHKVSRINSAKKSVREPVDERLTRLTTMLFERLEEVEHDVSALRVEVAVLKDRAERADRSQA